jgi:hypothetical protein
MGYDRTENSHCIPLELSDELKQEEIVTRFVKDKRTNSLILSLNHKYKQKNLIFTIPAVKKIDWTSTMAKIIKSFKANGISLEHIVMLEDVILTNYEIVLETDNPDQNAASVLDKQKESCFIHKYTANGLLSLHEAIVFADSGQSAFVYLDDNGNPRIVDKIDRSDKILRPKDNLDLQNPLPYVFASLEELQMYLELARRETFDSLYQQVKSELRKYVNIDEHYLVVIAADIIFSYFQDKFPTVHYDIFVGDNGSGKNSALLAISRLGYRVFYVVSASAANYFTFYGNIEECQGTIAEDEAGDLDKDYQKQKILKSGYTSGGTVPKTDFPNGKRSQAPYNVYSMKWLAMEDLPDSRKTKGIFDRSLVFKFIVGHVDYNIKDIIKNAGDPKFKPLYDKLVHIHKLLFAFRLFHYNDIIPDIRINIENRNAELTRPSLRLFLSRADAPIAVEEIRLALSKFIAEKNDQKANSIESKMYEVIIELIKERNDNLKSEDYDGLDDYEFTNEQIWNKCKILMNGVNFNLYRESFYSIDFGNVTHRRITQLYKSKFKAESIKTDGNNSKRGLRFPKEVLQRTALQYNCEGEIKISDDHDSDRSTGQGTGSQQEADKPATDASLASLYENPDGVFNENNKSTADCPTYNTEEDLSSSKSITEQFASSIDQDSNSTLSNKFNSNTNTLVNRYNYQSSDTSIKSLDNTFVENNDNSVDIMSKSSTENNNNPLSKSDLPAANTDQPRIYTNTPHTPSKCDASDASDASSATKVKTKAEQVGLPEIPCMYCDFRDCIDFDLGIHYVAKHRQQLVRLPIGKSSIDARADYAVELSKKKFAESFYDYDRDVEDDENESDE